MLFHLATVKKIIQRCFKPKYISFTVQFFELTESGPCYFQKCLQQARPFSFYGLCLQSFRNLPLKASETLEAYIAKN